MTRVNLLKNFPARILASTKVFLLGLTIEPLMFLNKFGDKIADGAQQVNNLQIQKICQYEFGYNETICGDLGNDAYDDIQNDVQVRLNNFHLLSNYIQSPPPILYTLFIGAISDRIGRRPMLIFPQIGMFIIAAAHILNYTFLEQWPLEAFLMDGVYNYLGGSTVFFLGVYVFGADASRPEERAHRLARLDGFESIGNFFGTLISPFLFQWTGYYGSFSIQLLCHAICIFSLIYLIKEPQIKKVESKGGEAKLNLSRRVLNGVKKHVFGSIKEMAQAVFRARERNLRALILLIFVVYGLYCFASHEYILSYVFLRKAMNDFDGNDFAAFNLYSQVTKIIFLTFLMPILGGNLMIHDAMLLVIFTSIGVVGQVIAAFSAGRLWLYYLAFGIKNIDNCNFGIIRSLLTKCSHPDERGKIFSALAFLAAFTPLASDTIFTVLYNNTLDYFPGAFYLLGASFYALATLILFTVWVQRRNMLIDRKGGEINGGYRDNPPEELKKTDELQDIKKDIAI